MTPAPWTKEGAEVWAVNKASHKFAVLLYDFYLMGSFDVWGNTEI